MERLPQLVYRSAERFGQQPALAIRRGLRTNIWRYAELPGAIKAAAARLQNMGLQPGGRVLVLAPNSPELVVSMLGVWQAGGVLGPGGQHTGPDVVQRIRAPSEASLLIALESIEGLGSEEDTSELQSRQYLLFRLLLYK